MTDKQVTFFSHNDEDAITNTSHNPSFDSILQMRLSRRQLLRGTAGAAAMAVFGSVGLGSAWAACQRHGDQSVRPHSLKLGFDAVPKSLADVVTVPPGYSYDVLYRLGDPIAAGVADYLNDGTDDPASFAQRAGDHHDGMSYFGLSPNGKRDENCWHWTRRPAARGLGGGYRSGPLPAAPPRGCRGVRAFGRAESWKQFLHPPRRQLWSAGPDGEFRPAEPASPRYAFLGVRGCDLAAIGILGRVLGEGAHPDGSFARARQGLFVVAVNCTEPGGVCFCASMGTGPAAGPGYDLALTEQIDESGHWFVAEAGSHGGRAHPRGGPIPSAPPLRRMSRRGPRSAPPRSGWAGQCPPSTCPR